MIIYIDIDQTICKSNPKDYSTAKPIRENIEKANELFDAGHTIIYWTARGMKDNNEPSVRIKQLTFSQLCEWGVKYSTLKFKKPYFDLFIDDKVLNTEDWE